MSEAAPARRRISSTAAAVPASASATSGGDGGDAAIDPLSSLCAMMEEVNDRLKLLNYENDFIRTKPHLALKPLHRAYFALPLKASEQFPYYSHLMSWLFGQCGREILEWNEFDDPNTISASIIEHLNILGCHADFQPVKLRHGSGEFVLQSLLFITALAIKIRGIRLSMPSYTDSNGHSDTQSLPNEDDSAGYDENEILDTIDDECQSLIFDAEESEHSDTFTSLNAHYTPVTNLTDNEAALWALEVERVSAQLKGSGSVMSLSNKEWRNHHELLLKHSLLLADSLPTINKDLERLSKLLSKSLERITVKEKILNRDYETLASEMRKLQHEYEDQQQQYTALSAELSTMTEKYRERVSEVESAKEKIDRKNEAMMDSTPVRVMQQTIKTMRKEILDMEVKIGIVNQCLQAARQRKGKAKGQAMKRDEKERLRKGQRATQQQQAKGLKRNGTTYHY